MWLKDLVSPMEPNLDIVIVDDKEEITELFSSMLGDMPRVSSIHTCKSLNELQDLLLSAPANVVVLDLNLIETRGLDTLTVFKSLFSSLPVVVVTGNDSNSLSFSCFLLGASEFLSKPDITPTLLYKACVYAVEKDIINAKIKRAEAELRAIVYDSPVPQFVIDHNHHIIFWNRALEEITGMKADQVVGKSQSWESFYPSARPSLADLLVDQDEESIDRLYGNKCGRLKLIEGAYEATDFFPMLGESGRWLHFTAVAIKDSKGNILGAVEIIDDITERLQMEEKNVRLATIVECSDDAIIGKTLDGKITDWNKGAENLYGYKPEEVIGKHVSILILPEYKNEITGLIARIIRGEHINRYETVRRRKDGKIVNVSLVISPILDNTNTVIGASTIARDITDRKTAEIALEHSELRYRRLFESAQDGILILDFDTGKILDVNPFMVEMLGYSHGEFVGKQIWEVSPFVDCLKNKDIFDRLQREGYVRYEDLPLETGDGRVLQVEFISNSYSVNGSAFIQCNVRNITERKEAEGQKEILQAQQELIINILKHLNKPYTGIQTIEELLKLIQDYTGVDAIGLRLQEGDDFPYFVYRGFDQEFIELENYLCEPGIHKSKSADKELPLLQCICGRVIAGLTDSVCSFFTKGGSFWTNSTTDPLSGVCGELNIKMRNQCNRAGYESVAIIPLSAGSEIIGCIQLNNKAKNKFTENTIFFMEELALSIAVAVKRAWQEDRIKILEIAKTRDLLESSRLVNSGVAHELRTPMQSILNCLELINEEVEKACLLLNCSDTHAHECYAVLRDTAIDIVDLAGDGIERTEYSIKVLNSLSDYSKIASNDELHLINVIPELKTIMRTLMFTDHFKSLSDTNFVLKTLQNNSDRYFISINRIDFSQLITNLCRNAREAIMHNDPEITIEVALEDGNVIITVIDNGKGIDASLGDRIFEPYFSTKENPDEYNQGLGLAMVRDTVAAYGGHIRYSSCPGCTKFVVAFPAQAPPAGIITR